MRPKETTLIICLILLITASVSAQGLIHCTSDSDCILPATCQHYDQINGYACGSDSICSDFSLIATPTKTICSGAPACTVINNEPCSTPTECCIEPNKCGNGVLEVNEQCDDGNNNNNDLCRNDCTFCDDDDNDGVCNKNDLCPDTPHSNFRHPTIVDPDGCSQIQFCRSVAQCGSKCDDADWLGNNYVTYITNDPYKIKKQQDCMTIIGHQNGIPIPICVAVEFECSIDTQLLL